MKTLTFLLSTVIELYTMVVLLRVWMQWARADFVVLGDRLALIPACHAKARRTMRIVRQNLGWAAAYNAVGVPMAMAGWMPPWAAGLGMAASSLLVVLNALRLSSAEPSTDEVL